MDFDYPESAQDALELLVDFGGAEPGLAFTRTTRGGFDPATGGGATAAMTFQGVGLIFAYTDKGGTTAAGSTVKAGDQKAYVAALTVDGQALPAPAKPDRVLAPDGITYTVENVDALAPAGQVVLYELHLVR
jgi:hypothetical protein